jgi:hypothetical protein
VEEGLSDLLLQGTNDALYIQENKSRNSGQGPGALQRTDFPKMR